jgi:hypothetical protein
VRDLSLIALRPSCHTRKHGSRSLAISSTRSVHALPQVSTEASAATTVPQNFSSSRFSAIRTGIVARANSLGKDPNITCDNPFRFGMSLLTRNRLCDSSKQLGQSINPFVVQGSAYKRPLRLTGACDRAPNVNACPVLDELEDHWVRMRTELAFSDADRLGIRRVSL